MRTWFHLLKIIALVGTMNNPRSWRSSSTTSSCASRSFCRLPLSLAAAWSHASNHSAPRFLRPLSPLQGGVRGSADVQDHSFGSGVCIWGMGSSRNERRWRLALTSSTSTTALHTSRLFTLASSGSPNATCLLRGTNRRHHRLVQHLITLRWPRRGGSTSIPL